MKVANATIRAAVSRALAACSISAACVGLTACISDETGPTGSESAALRVSVQTMGEDLDPDGYMAVLDDADTLAVAVNGAVTFSGIETGDRAVELVDVASNCDVTGQNPQTVSVMAGDTSQAAFDVACQLTLSNRIVYTSQRDDGDGLFVMNPDGSNPRPLTPAMGDFRPAVSPGGARVAFARNLSGGNLEIYVINADGTGLDRLTNDPDSDINPSWSPDGTKIAFSSNRSDGNFEIYVINVDGTGLDRLTSDPGADVNPAWSPDGTKIAFNSDRDGNTEIYVMDPDGTAVDRLTTHPDDDFQPDWSPDGSRIAFVRAPPAQFEEADIYVMNSDATGLARITDTAGVEIQPNWSPDGTRIAFTGNQGFTDGDIFVIGLDGTGLINLTNRAAIDQWPFWGR